MWTVFLLVAFAGGVAMGNWRAQHATRSMLSAAGLLPLLLAIVTLIVAGAVLLSGKRDSYADLAAIVVSTFGFSLVAAALIGGFAGAWYRRRIDPA